MICVRCAWVPSLSYVFGVCAWEPTLGLCLSAYPSCARSDLLAACCAWVPSFVLCILGLCLGACPVSVCYTCMVEVIGLLFGLCLCAFLVLCMSGLCLGAYPGLCLCAFLVLCVSGLCLGAYPGFVPVCLPFLWYTMKHVDTNIVDEEKRMCDNEPAFKRDW